MTRAILFDLDGTLVDSVPDLAEALNRLLEELGRPALDDRAVTGMVGDGAAKLVERALAARGITEIPLEEALARFLAFYQARAACLTRPYEGVPETLDRLAAAGYRLALCTNKPERATRAVLEGLGLARFFPVTLGGDSLPQRKPDPRPLHRALEELGGVAPRHAAMVGDHRNDVLAARAAGMASIFAGYGYGGPSLEGLVPDLTIDRFAALPHALDVIWRDPPSPSSR